MELKNALSVCLISLFAATLVVLIARGLDSQAAARLEPQLAAIVQELQAIRTQGGIALSPGEARSAPAAQDGLVVYYFHGNVRCPTCRAIEAYAKETVESRFADELKAGKLVWKVANYEQPAGAEFKKQFAIEVPVVVLARMQGGQLRDWRRLDEVWGLTDDRPGFLAFVGKQIGEMLADKASASAPPATPENPSPPHAAVLPAVPPTLPIPVAAPPVPANLPFPK